MAENKIINACAGSGKTYALIQRLLEILEKDKPGRILAITFTKKAAAEIHQRLLDALAEKVQGGHAWAREQRRRILLAETAADKIHIHTFHSWFHFLLSGESNPQSRRQLVESETALREEAWRRWLKIAEIEPPLVEILTYCSPLKLKEALFRTADNINAWRLFAEGGRRRTMPDPEPAKRRLRDGMKKFVDVAGDSPAAISQAKVAAENLLAGDDNGDWRKKFFTAQDTLRKNLIKAAENTGGDLPEILNNIADVDMELAEKIETRLTIQFDEKMAHLAELFLREYEDIKSEENVMTFNDLEYGVYAAARGKDGGDFLARINGQFRHILIDEFQDSSPLQWRIIHLWLKQAAANDKPPSVFIVGDKRQAIYRFRNGDARLLDEAANALQTSPYHGKIEKSDICRRCAPPILQLVNAVFPTLNSQHLKSNEDMPGRVEWNEPPESSPPPPPLRNPRNPLITPPAASAANIRREHWANNIGAKLEGLIGKVGIGDERRPCRPEDIMVLLPQLTHAKELAKVFEERGLPYSVRGGGVSFLHSFACRDILALLRALLSQKNNLSLAQTLKSPLFSFSESQLADVVGDGDSDLWERLMNADDAAGAQARERLARWRQWLRQGVLPAHDLLSKIYADGEVVNRYAAAVAKPSRRRVVGDLFALLDFSLNNDGGRKPLPHQFLSACAAAAKERTPPSADGGGGIELMTVHGAKGLEKPVVVVADTSFSKSHRGDKGGSVDLLVDWPATAVTPAEVIFRPRGLKRAYAQLVSREETLQETEYENLLYVAMTRARQFLLIFSTDEHNNPRAENLKKAVREKAKNENGVWTLGGQLPPASAAPPPPAAVPPPPPLPAAVGFRQTGAAKRGEELHRFVALLLAGLSEEEAARVGASEDDDVPAAARRILATPPLHDLLTHCAKFHSEAEFVEDGKIVRLDLLIIGKDGESWIVDYKSGGGDLSRHRPQLQKYREIVGKHLPQQHIRTAIVTAAGEWHEILPENG